MSNILDSLNFQQAASIVEAASRVDFQGKPLSPKEWETSDFKSLVYWSFEILKESYTNSIDIENEDFEKLEVGSWELMPKHSEKVLIIEVDSEQAFAIDFSGEPIILIIEPEYVENENFTNHWNNW